MLLEALEKLDCRQLFEVMTMLNWEKALKSYRYPVHLEEYSRSKEFPGFFKLDLSVGGREQTTEFEDYFRSNQAELGAWLAVVFWKMYSQGQYRREDKVETVRTHLSHSPSRLIELAHECKKYVAAPSKMLLGNIVSALGFSSRAIAIAATFPAFLAPDKFPMVDTRIAKWVGNNLNKHNDGDPSGPQLIRPRFLDNSSTVLTLSDYPFVDSWTKWCRYKARRLTLVTGTGWRARDVEMAVFTAWGNKDFVLEVNV